MSTRLFLLAVLSFLSCAQNSERSRIPVSERPIRRLPGVIYPAGARVINIKADYGAAGDGVKDDTGAIVQAIRDHAGTGDAILYFPNGRYLVSSTLEWKNAGGGWAAYLSFQGESEAGTVIRLRDRATGFGDPNSPKAVLYTAAQVDKDPSSPNGTGNEAFRNNICNLTVDTGLGNPGAVGIDYLANNQGRLSDVTVRSRDGSGKIGVSLTRRWVGPLLGKNLSVFGFDYGIAVAGSIASVTLEHISLTGQRVAGLRNDENVVSIRGLTSDNSVPAVQNAQWPALMTLMDVVARGGVPTISAVQNSGGARLYARNVNTEGYLSAISNDATAVHGNYQSDYLSDPARNLFDSPKAGLRLPVEETPYVIDTDSSDWTNVRDYGAGRGSDDLAAIQAAIDHGTSVVYFPPGLYHLSGTVHLRGKVRKLLGLGGRLVPLSSRFPAGQPAIQIQHNDSDLVVIERLVFTRNFDVTGEPEFPIAIDNSSASTVVLQDLMAVSYRNTPGAGRLFIEDVCCGPFEFQGQQVWARQLDSEGNTTKIRNVGGSLWILGLKTEGSSTVIETSADGRTELLGGFISLLQNVAADVPGFVNTESSHSLTYATTPDFDFATAISETRGTETRTLPGRSLPRRYKGSSVPLYVGYK
jgi:hypothetical protein